jgi:transcriptional regulator with XRE-family HTH domain
MFNTRTPDGRNNIVGTKLALMRKAKRISQRQLADDLQLIGLDIDKNAIQRIEAGQRFVTDIEVVYLAKVFETTVGELMCTD